MSPSECPSKAKQFITDFMQYSPLKKILALFWYAIFIIGMLLFLEQHDKLFLYIPTGKNMVYLEYFFLISLPFILWYTYKKQINNKEDCINGILDYLKGHPKIHLFFTSIFTFMLITFLFYCIGVTTTFLDLEKGVKSTSYDVKVRSVGTRGSVACRGNMETDFLEQLDIKNMTIFHKTMQAFHFDQICTRYSNTTQYIYPGEKVRIDVMETPWGVYVYNIP